MIGGAPDRAAACGLYRTPPAQCCESMFGAVVTDGQPAWYPERRRQTADSATTGTGPLIVSSGAVVPNDANVASPVGHQRDQRHGGHSHCLHLRGFVLALCFSRKRRYLARRGPRLASAAAHTVGDQPAPRGGCLACFLLACLTRKRACLSWGCPAARGARTSRRRTGACVQLDCDTPAVGCRRGPTGALGWVLGVFPSGLPH